jgi:hypothetical protein
MIAKQMTSQQISNAQKKQKNVWQKNSKIVINFSTCKLNGD